MDRRGISILIACALAAAGVVIVVSRAESPRRSEPSTTRMRAQDRAAPGHASGANDPPNIQPITREEAPPLATLVGRVTDAAGGAGIAGATVRVVTSGADAMLPIESRDTTTDADGRFELRITEWPLAGHPDVRPIDADRASLPGDPSRMLRLRIERPPFCPREMPLLNLRRGGAQALADISLRAGPRLTGWVTDSHGAAAGEFELFAWPVDQPSPLLDDPHAPAPLRIRVGRDGRFASESGAAPGLYALVSTDEARRVIHPKHVLVAAQVEPPPTHVHVLVLPTIRGQLRDQAGQPLAGILLRPSPGTGSAGVVIETEDAVVLSAQSHATITLPRTDAEGRFKFVATGPEGPPIRIHIAEHEPFLLAQESGAIPWGREGLVLVAVRKPGCHLRVLVGLAHGADALPGIVARLVDTHDASRQPDRALVAPRSLFPTGAEISWSRLAPGRHRLVVVPLDKGVRPARRTWVEISRAQESVTVKLDPMLAINVVLHDEEGAPIRGATVECIDVPDDGCPPDAVPLDRRTLLEDLRRMDEPLLLGRTQTDGDGYATIPVPLHGEHAVLRLRADGFVQSQVPCPARWEFDTELELRLARTQ